ncbi:MAG: hypothetical protein QNJ04_15280, partial [Desulfobacterales bacterium]|nr:hypothetical protein [Desulfobacterales bacterium]
QEAADLVEGFDLAATLDDLEQRLTTPAENGAAGRLARGILDEAGAKSPLDLSAGEFNTAAEAYYRGTLRRRQIQEGLTLFARDLAAIDAPWTWRHGTYNRHLLDLLDGRDARKYLYDHKTAVLDETADEDALQTLICLFILTLHHQADQEKKAADAAPSPNED